MDGLTETQHGAIFKEVKELMMVDPGSLLDKHCHLLEQDFGALNEGSVGVDSVGLHHWRRRCWLWIT